MKILVIGNFTTGWDGSICDEEHIATSLEKLEHEVERWQREETNNPTTPAAHDVVLIAQWNQYPANLVDRLKESSNGLIVYWAFDYQEDGQDWHERLVKEVDLYLSKPLSDSKYDNWQWLSQDFSPPFLDKVPTERKDIDVLFTGTYLPWAKDRIEVLKAVDKEFNLHVFSMTPDDWKRAGLKNVNGPVMDIPMSGIVSRAKINLSIDHTISAGYWSDRNAQIMASGGVVLFKYVPLSEAVFRNHVLYFNSVDECLDKLRYWLEPGRHYELGNFRHQGYKFAHANLMVDNRVKDFITIVESRQWPK